MDIRIDKVVIYGLWMNRMYSLILKKKVLYLIHTGRAVRIHNHKLGIMYAGARKIVDKGLEKIEKVEKEISDNTLEKLASTKHSYIIPLEEINKAEFKKGPTAGLFVGDKMTLHTNSKTLKIRFLYNKEDEVQELFKQFPH